LPFWSRDNTGRFTDRPFYTQAEIEAIALAELEACAQVAGHRSEWPLSDDMLVRLVESLTVRFDPYCDLSHVGVDVDGYTLFTRRGRPSVLINQDLASQSNRLRWRVTIAHEVGHVILHQPLYQRKDRRLDMLVEQPLVPAYCERLHMIRSVDWCEWQASFFSNCLLMPTQTVRAHLLREIPDLLQLEDGTRDAVRTVAAMSEQFDVPCESVRSRLAQVGVLKPSSRLDNRIA